jgi:hypothetical protein
MSQDNTELRFRRFLKDVGNHWVELMSGGLITVALGFIERLSGRNFPLYVYLCVVFFFIMLACFRAWRDAQKRTQDIQEQLEKEYAQNLFPEIKAELKEVYLDPTVAESKREGEACFDYYITLNVYLVNTRPAPTSVESFGLRVKTNTGEYEAVRTSLDGLILKRNQRLVPKWAIRYSKIETTFEELLDLEKLSYAPLTRGEGRRGWLRFVLSEAWSPSSNKVESVTLVIRDAYGNSHLVTANRLEWKKTGEVVNRYQEEIRQQLNKQENN